MNRLTGLIPVAASLLGATLIFGCSDEATAPATPEFAKARAEAASKFTRCRPEPDASGSAWIGTSGGTLKAGRHLLKVPAGALSAATLITMESPSDTINRVVLGPEGLTFHAGYSPRLVMSYKNCLVSPGAKQSIVYVDPSLSIIETTASATDTISLTVHGKLKHFSEYVLLSTYAVVY